ncbi:MAG TPA: CRISPR-associated protein Cas4 [Haloplasmataceae bacterium]
MIYNEDNYLMLSGIQHFYFCKRQWALIHIEQQWDENEATMEGLYLHSKVDNPLIIETRKDTFVSRAVPISSPTLGLSGIVDVLEFIKDSNGIKVPNKEGKWIPNIVEYKNGKPKPDHRDIVQLVAQVICLEEKLNCNIKFSDFYYNEVKRRMTVEITNELRNEVYEVANEMHKFYQNKITPQAETYKNCTKCSLYNICLPRLTKKIVNINNYISKYITGGEE